MAHARARRETRRCQRGGETQRVGAGGNLGMVGAGGELPCFGRLRVAHPARHRLRARRFGGDGHRARRRVYRDAIRQTVRQHQALQNTRQAGPHIPLATARARGAINLKEGILRLGQTLEERRRLVGDGTQRMPVLVGAERLGGCGESIRAVLARAVGNEREAVERALHRHERIELLFAHLRKVAGDPEELGRVQAAERRLVARRKAAEGHRVRIAQDARRIPLEPRRARTASHLADKAVNGIGGRKVQKRRHHIAHGLAGNVGRPYAYGQIVERQVGNGQKPAQRKRPPSVAPHIAHRIDQHIGVRLLTAVFAHHALLAGGRPAYAQATRRGVIAPPSGGDDGGV